MKLKELIQAVNEKKLTKEEIEQYRDQLANLYAQLQLELAEIRKAKAIFFIEHPEKTDKATERVWQAKAEGQREIELSHYCKAVEKIISSLKDRLYRVY